MPITLLGASNGTTHHPYPYQARWFSGGDRLLVTAKTNRMAIVDSSDKTAPFPLGSVVDATYLPDVIEQALGFNDAETVAYVYVNGQFSCWSVTGSAPVRLGTLALAGQSGNYNAVARYGNRIYFGSAANGTISIVDVSNPAAPVVEATFSGGSGSTATNGTAVMGSQLIVPRAARTGYDVWDLAANPVAPTFLGEVAWGSGTGGPGLDPVAITAVDLAIHRAANGPNNPALVHGLAGSPGSLVGAGYILNKTEIMAGSAGAFVICLLRSGVLDVHTFTTGDPLSVETFDTGWNGDYTYGLATVAPGYLAIANSLDFTGEANTNSEVRIYDIKHLWPVGGFQVGVAF